MNSTPVLTLGTPLGTWQSRASTLLGALDNGLCTGSRDLARWHERLFGGEAQSLEDARRQAACPLSEADLRSLRLEDPPSGLWGAVDARACWSADLLAQAVPGARFVVFVESPEEALAAWLTRGEAGDPQQFLATWCDGARRLLRHSQRQVGRCFVVLAEEAFSQSRAFLDRCAAWLEAPSPATAPAMDDSRGGDPLSRALARTAADGDASARALFGELLASCQVLAGNPGVLPPPIDGLAGARAYQALLTDGRRARVAGAERDAARAEVRRLERAMQACTREADLQLVLLQQLQEEVEVLSATPRAVVAAPSQAPMPSVLEPLQQALEAARAEARRATHELGRERAGRQAELQTRNLLELQLQQLQEELEFYFTDQQQRALAARRVDAGPVQAGPVELGAVRDTPPYRELGATIQSLCVAGQERGPVAVRLVEHHGRAGLVVLSTGRPQQALAAWQAGGSEGGRDFMLIVPEDQPSWRCLERFGTTDWRVLGALVGALEAALREADSAGLAFWRVTVRRLARLLDLQGQRMRYDGLSVTPAAGEPGALDVEFLSVLAAGRHFPRVSLRWRLQSTGPGELSLRCAPDSEPLLAAWPVADGGTWVAEQAIPVGAGLPRHEKKRRWAALAPSDRDALLAVLDALPAAAGLPGLPSAHPPAHVTQRAVALRKDAHRTLRAARWARAVRAMLRRRAGSA